jgi:hypothetical protein
MALIKPARWAAAPEQDSNKSLMPGGQNRREGGGRSHALAIAEARMKAVFP